jgi:hypothetical protein
LTERQMLSRPDEVQRWEVAVLRIGQVQVESAEMGPMNEFLSVYARLD